MGETTLIDWTNIPDYVGGTWNPWQGCTKISAGCTNCYMFRDKRRYGQDPSVVVRSAPATFNLPARTKEPHAWFVCSWSDFFHPAADLWRYDAHRIIESNPQHLYLILTKRIEFVEANICYDWLKNWPSNVWLGVTAENQEMADKRIPLLLDIPARVRFVSCEPLLSHIDLRHIHGDHVWFDVLGKSRFDYGEDGYGVAAPMSKGINQVIVGGESGPHSRPMDLNWARDLRDQCKNAGISYFFKQVGGTKRIDGHWGGDLLDGVQYHEFPKT